MKKFVKLATVIIVILMSITVSAAEPDLHTMDGPHYLVDDQLGMIMTRNNAPIITGWDVDVSGGVLTGSHEEEFFRFRDTSKAAPVSMSKRLEPHSSGLITVETSLKFAASSNGMCLRLSQLHGEKDIISFTAYKNALYVVDAKGKMTKVSDFKLNRFYGVKLLVDLDAKKTQLYFDGKIIGSFDFKDDANGLDFIQFKTDEKSIADFYINGLKIYTGYELNEQFFSYVEGPLAQDWVVQQAACVLVEAQESRSRYWPDVYSLHINDYSNVEGADISRKFKPLAEHSSFEAKFATEEKKQDFTMHWKGNGRDVFTVALDNNGFYVNGKKLYDCIENIYYTYTIDADFSKNTADIYLNHKLMAEDFPFKGAMVDEFAVTSKIIGKSEFWLDDLRAYKVNEPTDYVPEPVKAESDGFTLGMQTCDMWRDGQHLGWEYAYADTDRHPYLGFYDEGSKEASDWQNKWMIEHGIDFRMPCWFVPKGWTGGPIQHGTCSYELNEGYLRSEYSDQLGFMIMWENAGATKVTGEAFRKYIIPYWVEYYFKDPRYLVIDNKPVVSIYLADYFFKYQSGDDENEAKRNVQAIRDACKAIGFDDAIVLCARSSQSELYAEKIGADGMHNYNYAVSEYNNGGQINNLRNTKEKYDNIFVAGSSAQGREESAWFRAKGPYETVENFKKNLEYVKNEHYENYDAYTLSEKLCFILTWNEYCEGHYVAPCGLAGFDYLNAVGDVFTDGNHNDAMPTQEQKEDFCILFQTEGREPIIRGEDATLPIPDKVVHSWSGESLEKWTIGKQIENFRFENGIMKGTANGMDPSVMSETNLNIPLNGVTYIRIRMKQHATAKAMSIFFITDTDKTWNEAKGITLTPENTDSDYYDVYFPVWIRAPWKGKLMQLRIDPINTMGDFEIVSVELLKDEGGGLVNFSVDGKDIAAVSDVKSSAITIPEVPVRLNGTVYLPLTLIKKYGAVEATYVPTQKCIKMVKDQTLISINVETGDAFRNGKKVGNVPLDKYNERWIVGARAAYELLGFKVEWNDAESKVMLTSPPVVIPEGSDPAGTWNFNEDGDMQNWVANSRISSAVVSDGIMYITSSGTSPTLSVSGLNLDTSKYTVLRMRVKNTTSNGQAIIYFTTDLDTVENEAKRFTVLTNTKETDFTEYEVDLSTNPNWKGKLKTFRLDPTHATGDMEIDYIILSEE